MERVRPLRAEFDFSLVYNKAVPKSPAFERVQETCFELAKNRAFELDKLKDMSLRVGSVNPEQGVPAMYFQVRSLTLDGRRLKVRLFIEFDMLDNTALQRCPNFYHMRRVANRIQDQGEAVLRDTLKAGRFVVDGISCYLGDLFSDVQWDETEGRNAGGVSHERQIEEMYKRRKYKKGECLHERFEWPDEVKVVEAEPAPAPVVQTQPEPEAPDDSQWPFDIHNVQENQLPEIEKSLAAMSLEQIGALAKRLKLRVSQNRRMLEGDVLDALLDL